jgi:hypothetical protein
MCAYKEKHNQIGDRDIHTADLIVREESRIMKVCLCMKQQMVSWERGPDMDEGILKTPIPKCRLYWSFFIWGGVAIL